MRIDRLDLMAFGPFSGQSLALDGGKCGLHIVYGTNEAGKSSALRALRQFLFGIPNACSDNFLHANADLRLGARLRDAAGDVLECVRRKGKTNTLRTVDESANVDPDRLARLLGGLDESAFALQFGIDSAALENGGRAIVEGKGELGAALFAAGSGIVDLRRVQEQLTAEAKGLFVPSGKVPVINKALSELAEAKKRVKGAQLQTADWEAHDKQLKDAAARRQMIDEQLQGKRGELSRNQRIEKALPWVARRKQALAELTEVADAALLADDFSQRWRLAQSERGTKEPAASESAVLAEKLAGQIAELNPSEELLQNQSVVKLLYEGLGAFRKAQQDRPNLEKLKLSHEEAASGILRELVPSAELSRAEALRVSRVERHQIQTLGQNQHSLDGQCEAAGQQVEELQAAIEQKQREPAAAGLASDPAPLREALRAWAGQRDLDQQLAEDRGALAHCEQETLSELQRLPLWQGRLSELVTLAVPAVETIEHFDQELGEAGREIKAIDQRIAQLDETGRELQQNLERLRLARDVPTEIDLASARERREEGWRLVRRTWEEGRRTDAEVEAFVQEFGTAGTLASAYESSVTKADVVADRLRREAEHVAQKAQFLANVQKNAESQERLVEQRGACEGRLSELRERWQRLWQPLGIAPLSPREMRAWHGQHGRLISAAAAVRRQQSVVDQLEKTASACLADLQRALSLCGQSVPKSAGSCSALLRHVESIAEALEEQRAAERDREKELDRLKQELTTAQRQREGAQTKYEEWQKQWQQVTRRLELPDDASPAAVNEVLAALDELFDRLRQAKELDKRIEGIDRDATQYANQLTEIAAVVGFAFKGQPIDRAVSGLHDQLIAAQQVQVRRDELQRQQQREQNRHHSLRGEIRQQEAALAAMCAEAGVDRIDDLPVAEQRSAKRRHCEDQIRECEDRLWDLAVGTELAAFIAETEATAADELPSAVARLTNEIDQLENERTEVDRTIGSERLVLKQMDGSAAAALAQEEAISLAAQVRSAAEQYRRLKLSSAVLARAIERYRERHQGPVVQLASKLFGSLTLGSFEGLRADYGEDGQAVLVGVRPGGRQTVAVEGMSSGARDQLYLALRLASLHTYLDTKEPIPFIVDDVLVQFDDERSVAALQALAELSSRTQVIFFTHHEHLVELAGRCLPAAVLYKHRLDCRSSSAGQLSSTGVLPATNSDKASSSPALLGDRPARQKLFNSVPN